MVYFLVVWKIKFLCLVEVQKDLGSKKLTSSDVNTVFFFLFIIIILAMRFVARKVL